ncbi:hypothetical protein BN1708_018189, partial [Verticillium longisporum]
DFSESRQYYYIILELAPGGELFHQIVRLTYFSEELSRHVIVQVAKALEYLHEERGVVHRYLTIDLGEIYDCAGVSLKRGVEVDNCLFIADKKILDLDLNLGTDPSADSLLSGLLG